MVKAEICDYVEIKTGDEKFVGILMPESSNQNVVLKLENGYNVGIDKKNVRSIKVLKKKKEKEIIKSVKERKNLPTIAIVHTGGTIASKVDYETGGVIARFSPSELISMFPELNKIANIRSELVENISSEDMRFCHYNKIAKQIKKEVKKGVEGIIVTHGTDTMHYSSAALSFMLEDLSVPVIFVGSQRSSDRGSTDAKMNLLCAAQFIVNSDFAEVGLCMHSNMDDENCVILPGLKNKKLHSSRRDAFNAINTKPWAKVDVGGKIVYLRSAFNKKSDKKLKITLFDENLKVGILKAHPNMFPEEISNYSKFDGLILEGTGLGHLPINGENSEIFDEIKKLNKKLPIVMCSQTIFGRVNMNVYSPGRMIQDYVISGNDMTSETAFIKLAWLLSQKEKNISEKMIKNLKGEINDKISDEFI